MTNISLIAVVDENLGLGKNNQLLCHLPADLKHFKKITMGKPIIMGSKTYHSIGKPLPGRQNIVLSKQMQPVEGVEVAHTLEQALSFAGCTEEIMIIGGANIYEQFISMANAIYLTVIHHKFEADKFFPALEMSDWSCASVEHKHKDAANCYDMTFYHYLRLSLE